MDSISKLLKIGLIFVLILTLGGCNLARITSRLEPFPTVAALPLPQLPDWIEEISPTGEAKNLAQVRIRFKSPLIPLEALDSEKQQDLLKKFEILPPIPGRFRFLTPRMVGFQAEEALSKATRFQITLKAGLTDLDQHSLSEDLAWTFNTEIIRLSNLPGSNGNSDEEITPVEIKPKLEITSNVELDLDSLQKQVSLIAEGKNKQISLKILPVKQENSPQEQFNTSEQQWLYAIIPQQTLDKATRYRLNFAPGLRPVRGNLFTESPIVTFVDTYAPLALAKLEFYGQPDAGGTYGRFVKGSPQLRFNNGIVAKSATENITVTPSPQDSPLVRAYDGDTIVSLNPWVLAPTTNYTITIGANLQDKFGQTLGKTVTLQYNTGDVAGDIWTPTGLNIFPTTKDLQLNISAVNLPENQYKAVYRVVQPEDLVYTNYPYPSDTEEALLPATNTWSNFPIRGKKNQNLEIAIPLREKLGGNQGMLVYGVQARTNRYQQEGVEYWREAVYSGLVELTNLGVFAQWFPNSGIVRVNHLDDGSIVSNATVELYRSKLGAKQQTKPQPCLVAQSDATGTLLITGENWQKCLQGQSFEFGNGPELLVIAKENQDWAFTRTEGYSGAYGYGVDAGWDDGKPLSRGIIFSDRQLYQPNEVAWFTGTAYYLDQGSLRQDKNTPYQVTLESPDGKVTDLGKYNTNQFGTFSLKLPLKANQTLGYYTIRGKSPQGVEIAGEFRVAEFKPPNFKVDLNLNKKFASLKEDITAITQSNYLFGSPVVGGKAKYYVTRSYTNFQPQGWEKFNFGRQWFWPEERPEVESNVLQSHQVLDAEGKVTQLIKVEENLPYPMQYRVDAEVSDVSNLSVSASETFVALPSNRLIGVKNDWVADANKPFSLEIIVTDAEGKILSGEKVKIELQKINYSSVTQVVEGSVRPRNQVEFKTVEKTEITSKNEPTTASLQTSEAGSYRIRLNFANGKDETTATDVQIWVTGETPTFWGDRYENNRLEVRLDQDEYQPGQIATALIESPYPEAELYFAVVRDKILYQTITKVSGSAPEIKFTVTPEMLPNAAVEAVLVRQGKPLAEVNVGNLDKLVKIGFAPFNTSVAANYLNISSSLQAESLTPGGQQTIQLELKDGQNNPVTGQFTVMVVNEAVLQLSGYRPPDMVKTVYAEQPITTRFSDNRPDVILQSMSSPLAKGWGYGGGISAAAANTRIREDFQALAYYNGAVLTDDQGKANVSFSLPDDLTTWRVMVVATDGNLRFGNGEKTFITTKTLISNPVLPQFVRQGDQFEAGVAVTNTKQETGNLNIQGSLTGNIKFTGKQQLRTQAPTNTEAYRFSMVADQPGKAQVQFTTQLNGESDAFSVPLEVKSLAVTEQVVETGITQSQVTIPVKIDKQVARDSGGLDIYLASTLIPEIVAPARQTLGEDDLPFLEPVASHLAIASNLQDLSQKSGQSFSEFNPPQQANLALTQLQKLQKADGGFASYPRQEESNPFLTSYAATTIAQAQAVGFPVDAEMISRVKTYLQQLIANPGKYDYCGSQECKNRVRLESLIALAAFGDKRRDFLVSLVQQQEILDTVTQIKLARYLFEFPEWQTKAENLLNNLQEIVSQSGRSATVNDVPPAWYWLNSPTTTQAQMLRLFIVAQGETETSDRLLQGLLNQRRDGTWGNTYDNAQALTAIVEYQQLQPTPPNFTATATLGRKQIGKTRFEGYRQTTIEFNIPMQQLPQGENNLILQKAGEGSLHYLAAYNYRLEGNQPGRFQGLLVNREIRVANQKDVLRRWQLYTKDEPLKLNLGEVYDIGLEIITDHPVNHVVIKDYLPAGLEAVDTSFQTANPYFQAQAESWEINYQQIYHDRLVAYADSLTPGVYQLHYLVRSVTPGNFVFPGAEVRLQYEPEEFGRCASSSLVQ